jgi:hypothetical protein
MGLVAGSLREAVARRKLRPASIAQQEEPCPS